MLACLYADNVNELITFDYKPPYSNLKRTKERIAGEKAALKLRKKLLIASLWISHEQLN